MSFRRAIKVVNDVFDSDQDNDVFSDKKAKGKNIDTSYIDNEDDEESGSGADGNDEEEAGDEVIEKEVKAITTPGTRSSKRKALNFIPDSSTPSKKPKRKAVAETPTKTKPKSTAKAAGEKAAQKGRHTKA
ncbi:hypothetical protein MFIFM68171_03089 [Madurella fahalii]|uniref:Uncharacterized protein n=1 Tax=Madurella fahalii TaxID=1157608 RepID=A0ABQ0G578_9PEZI